MAMGSCFWKMAISEVDVPRSIPMAKLRMGFLLGCRAAAGDVDSRSRRCRQPPHGLERLRGTFRLCVG